MFRAVFSIVGHHNLIRASGTMARLERTNWVVVPVLMIATIHGEHGVVSPWGDRQDGSKGPLAMKLYNNGRRRRNTWLPSRVPPLKAWGTARNLRWYALSGCLASTASASAAPDRQRRSADADQTLVKRITDSQPKGKWLKTDVFFSRIHFLPRLMGRFAAHFTVYGRFWGSSSVFYLCWVYSLFYRMFKHIYE